MERLSAGRTDSYSALEGAIHVGRYAPILPLSKGRRVLDIACGEGYGTWLLAQSDATSVLGVDLSREAVNKAKKNYKANNLKFRSGTIDDLVQKADEKYDLITCIETIEHVRDPVDFLKKIDILRSSSCVIYITCPNDHWYYAPNSQNPYHMSKYTFEEFQELTKSVLGEEVRWFFGTAAQGFATCPVGQAAPSGPTEFVSLRSMGSALVCSPDPKDNLGVEQSAYFIGVWGDKNADVLGGAFFPTSMDHYGRRERGLSESLQPAPDEECRAKLASQDVTLQKKSVEIEALRETLRRDAEGWAAERKELTEKLLTAEWNNRNISEENESLRSSNSDLVRDRDERTNALSLADERASGLSTSIERLGAEVSETRALLDTRHAECGRLSDELAALTDTLAEANARYLELSKSHDALETLCRAREVQANALLSENRVLLHQVERLFQDRAELERLREEHRAMTADLRAASDDLADAMRSKADANSRATSREVQANALLAENRVLLEQVERLSREHSDIQNLRQEHHKASADLRAASDRLAQAERVAADANSQASSREAEASALRAENRGLLAQIEALSAVVKDRHGARADEAALESRLTTAERALTKAPDVYGALVDGTLSALADKLASHAIISGARASRMVAQHAADTVAGIRAVRPADNKFWRDRAIQTQLFDESFYLSKYPDVANSRIDPLSHFLKHGARENRQPSARFVPTEYMASIAQPPTGRVNAATFYLLHGGE